MLSQVADCLATPTALLLECHLEPLIANVLESWHSPRPPTRSCPLPDSLYFDGAPSNMYYFHYCVASDQHLLELQFYLSWFFEELANNKISSHKNCLKREYVHASKHSFDFTNLKDLESLTGQFLTCLSCSSPPPGRREPASLWWWSLSPPPDPPPSCPQDRGHSVPPGARSGWPQCSPHHSLATQHNLRGSGPWSVHS